MKETASKTFHEFLLFSQNSRLEIEANVFAAEVMMKDSEVIQALRVYGGFFEAAAELNAPPELLDFKFRTMRAKGYDMPSSPILTSSDFMKNI